MINKLQALIQLFRGVEKQVLVSILLSLFLGITEGASLLLIIPLLAMVGVDKESEAQGGLVDKLSNVFESLGLELSLINILVIYVIVLGGYSVLRFLLNINTVKISQRVIVSWRNLFFQQISNSPWKVFKASRLTDYQNVLIVEIKKFGAIVIQLISLIGNLILLIVYLLLSAFLSLELTLISLVPILIIGLLNRSINLKTYNIGKSAVNFNQNLQSTVLEYLSAMKLVKIYQKEKQHNDSFINVNQKLEKELVKFQWETQKTKILFEVLAAIMIALYIYLALEVFKSDTKEVLLLIFIFARLVPKAVKLVGNYQRAINLLPAVEKAKELLKKLSDKERVNTENQGQSNFYLTNKIELRNIDFSYGSNKVLQNISFKIKMNEITLLKGESGSGKSTIIDLLLGLHEPEDGEIFIDTIPLSDLRKTAWLSTISYVPQEPYLFHDSIRANILWGNSEATDKEIWEVLDLLSATDLVKSLPNGLHTVVGDRGAQLSGGERQRIILARALIRKPKILVLDEATNELDAQNSALIAKALVKNFLNFVNQYFEKLYF